jgi:two-component system cell cycle sensor histidine kinase/response regulator CckA
MLAVTDTGMGMDREMRQHIFEPFFTTKERGQGTGLGLATIYGIVTQSGGHIWLYSEPGRGTSFKVYFPRVGAPDTTGADGPSNVAMSTRVLLVEDEETVRDFTRHVLERYGYEVVTAADGPMALDVASRDPRPIDALVTDVVMPGMSGRALATRLRELRPGLPILLVSGYTAETLDTSTGLGAGMAFLSKPFSPDALIERLEELIKVSRRASPGQ